MRSREGIYIYVILAAELSRVKVGISNQPKHRLYELQCGCPCTLEIIRVEPIEGTAREERKLHAVLREFHVRGEWFDYTPACQMLIDWYFKKHQPSDTATGEPIVGYKRCTAEKCMRKRRAKGFCREHYRRWKEYGDPNFTKRAPRKVLIRRKE